jgi:hypothetical protein
LQIRFLDYPRLMFSGPRRQPSSNSRFLPHWEISHFFSKPGHHTAMLSSACVAPFSTRSVEGEPSRRSFRSAPPHRYAWFRDGHPPRVTSGSEGCFVSIRLSVVGLSVRDLLICLRNDGPFDVCLRRATFSAFQDGQLHVHVATILTNEWQPSSKPGKSTQIKSQTSEKTNNQITTRIDSLSWNQWNPQKPMAIPISIGTMMTARQWSESQTSTLQNETDTKMNISWWIGNKGEYDAKIKEERKMSVAKSEERS